MQRGRSASVSTIASFVSALDEEYVTPSLSSEQTIFFPAPPSPQPPFLQDHDVDPQNEEEYEPSEGPSTPRARPALTVDAVNSLGKSKGSFWIGSGDDDEDENEEEDDTRTEDGIRRSISDIYLERLSTSSRGTQPESLILGASDPFLELELGGDPDLLSEGGSLPSEDEEISIEGEEDEDWDGLNQDEESALQPSIRMDQAGSRAKARGVKRRKRRKWREAEQEFARGGYKDLWQLVPPQLLSYPLVLLPIVPLLPGAFLPGGTAVFIPLIAIIASLSACAQMVITYLSRYLRVTNFEDVLHRSAGRYGLYVGRGLQMVGILCTCVGWLRTVHPIWLTVIHPWSTSHFLASKWLALIVSSFFILPLPSRSKPHTGISLLPDLLIFVIPMVIFTVIGRTVEIMKEENETIGTVLPPEGSHGPFGVDRLSAGTALVSIVFFFTPHVRTLPIHGTLVKTSRSWFPLPCVISAGTLLVISLPFALVPYYLFNLAGTEYTLTRAGIFQLMQSSEIDGALNFGRICMIALILTTANQWVGQARAVGLRALGVEREGRAKAQRWLSMAMWSFILLVGCIGGTFADKLETIGAICVLSVGWLVPAILFVKNFYLSSPLAIVFPATAAAAQRDEAYEPVNSRSVDVDVLLARKEKELQRRRTGRRLWQDLIVFVGVLPIGLYTVVWLLLLLLGVDI